MMNYYIMVNLTVFTFAIFNQFSDNEGIKCIKKFAGGAVNEFNN